MYLLNKPLIAKFENVAEHIDPRLIGNNGFVIKSKNKLSPRMPPRVLLGELK